VESPVVSVVTVVRNDREGLLKTLASVVSQDFHGIEYVVVDGASTDGTAALIEEETAKITRWISEPDHGVYDAMNKGWRLATGDWVVFLNAADRFLDPGVVSVAMGAASAEIDAIYGDAYYELEETRHLMVAGSPEDLPMGPFCCHQSLFMRREVIEGLGGFSLGEWPASDYGLIARAFAAGCRWQRVSRPFVSYVLGGISDVHARRGRLQSWAISRKVFGTTLQREIQWAHLLFRDLVREALRSAGLKGLVMSYQRLLARARTEPPPTSGER
jgi:glycosyltransferase involved in cell wall biosynthesis